MNGEVADLVLRAYNEPMDQTNAENSTTPIPRPGVEENA